MAVTISSDKISSGVMKVLPLGYTQHILATAAAPATQGANDIYKMIALEGNPSGYMPNGAGGPTILGVVLGSDDLDGGASVALSVGDSGSATRFLSSSTIGQAGGVVRSTLAPALGYQPFASPFYATYTTVSLATYLMLITVTTSAATALAGNIRLLAEFSVDP